jgi:Icc protein
MLDLRGDQAGAPGPLPISIEGLREFPMYFLPGNHDDRNSFFQYLFPQALPMPLMNVVFVHKGVQFICLDWGAQSKAIAHLETLDFLARSLQTDLPSIILMHHHPVAIGSRWLDYFIADDIDRFWEIVTGRNVMGIFCGHVHITYDRVIENIPVFGLRSTAFPFALQDEPLLCLLPPQYRFVTIHNGVLTTRIFEVPL